MRRYFKALLFISLFLMAAAPCCDAGVITLEWDPLTDEGVTGVIIYVSPAGQNAWSRAAKVAVPATTVRLRLPDIVGGYDYKATAYKLRPWRESVYSNTVTGTPDAAKTDRAAVLVAQ